MRFGLAVGLALLGCTAPELPEPDACEATSQSAALEAVDRKIAGDAQPYRADGTLRGRDAELAQSKRARREVAWRAVEELLAPVPLAESIPKPRGAPALPQRLPLWQTWYSVQDLRRVFHRLYDGLEDAGRRERAPFSNAEIEEGFAWNVNAVDDLPNWPAERYLEYLDAIDEAAEVAGIGGVSRVGYSPAAARHLLGSYPEVLGCREAGPPPAFADGPKKAVRVARQSIAAEPCETQFIGSYAVAEGEVLRVAVEGGDGATLVARTADSTCAGDAATPCAMPGPASVTVTIEAGDVSATGSVEVTRESANPPWAACVDGPFPFDAAVVKADFRRADFEMKLPVHSTSAAALAERMAGAEVWDPPQGEADPGEDEIYTVQLAGGTRYRLAGLHLMTKELDHWLWITLWWSDSPDEDFGEDRPASIAAMGGPWRNYKMCVVTAFEEGDPRAGGGYDDEYPSLAAALAAVHRGRGAPSWCSNPYLEEGEGNAATNCVGCHQHGGTPLLSEDILAMPAHGATLLRNNFPSDYSWAVNSGDDLGLLFQQEEDYYLGPSR